jgi:hypothetical protein
MIGQWLAIMYSHVHIYNAFFDFYFFFFFCYFSMTMTDALPSLLSNPLKGPTM